MIPAIAAGLLAKLAESGLTTLASAVQAKGKEFIEEKLGVNLEQEVSSEEGILRLRQLEVDREEFLVNAALKQAEQDLEAERIAAADRDSARTMNAKIQESANASALAKNAAYYLDFFVVGSTVLLGLFLFFVPVPPANKELAYTTFGALLALSSTIINFHRGSSASGRGKDSVIEQLIAGRRSDK